MLRLMSTFHTLLYYMTHLCYFCGKIVSSCQARRQADHRQERYMIELAGH